MAILSPTADTYIYMEAPDTSYGAEGSLVEQEYNGDSKTGAGAAHYRHFLEFDVSRTGLHCMQATLHRYCLQNLNGTSLLDTVYICLQDFGEDATWNHYTDASDWGTAGCGLEGTDYHGGGLDPQSPSALVAVNTWQTKDVKAHVNWARDNDGSRILRLFCKMVDAGANPVLWASQDYADDTTKRPYLEIIEKPIPQSTVFSKRMWQIPWPANWLNRPSGVGVPA